MIALTVNIFAADGDLDVSFGTSGIVTDTFNGSFGIFARSVKIQPDGRILVGSAVLGADFANYDFGLLRYNTNGTLDASFGTGGRQIVDVDSEASRCRPFYCKPMGKLSLPGSASLTVRALEALF